MRFLHLLTVLLFASSMILAHTDKSVTAGCHDDSETGKYHCHSRGDSYKAAATPVFNANLNSKDMSGCESCSQGKPCGSIEAKRAPVKKKRRGCGCGR